MVAVSQGLGPGVCGAREGGALAFWVGIFEASLLRRFVVRFGSVLLGQLGFVSPGRKLFPSLAWRSCSSNLSAALWWTEELLVWGWRSGTGESGAGLFQPQALGSRIRETKHTKRLCLLQLPSCFVCRDCCGEKVDAREPSGFHLLLELLCGSSTSLRVKASAILHHVSGGDISSTFSPFYRHFLGLCFCVCVFLCVCGGGEFW